jgi:hypothetical protein
MALQNIIHHRMECGTFILWWVDTILFAGFLVVFFISLTEGVLHQWIGVFGWLLALYYLITHWDWVNGVNQTFFKGATRIVRIKFTVDRALMVGFLLIVLTGVVISTWLDLTLINYAGWLSLHIQVSIITLSVLAVKLALHWKWIIKMTRSTVPQSNILPIKPVALQPGCPCRWSGWYAWGR